jgi:hypothetical protein
VILAGGTRRENRFRIVVLNLLVEWAPGALRDPKVREDALHELCFTIVHQGTRYWRPP